MRVRIFYDGVKYRFPGWRKAVKLIKKVIRNEGKVLGDLTFIITTDDSIRKINVEFLNHDYNTDVITFNYNEGDEINGEIYISRDTVKSNSYNYNVSLNQEVLRVMIHGLLHLLGYNDKNDREKKVMQGMEEKWLSEKEEE